MKNDVETLSKTLLNPVKDVDGDRAEAAVLLASHLLDIRAFNALFSICAFPDMHAIEDGLLPIVGESIGKIISERDLQTDPLKHHKLNPKYFDSFHPDALKSALSALTEKQRDEVYQFSIENPLCSEAMTFYFYQVACERALSLYESNVPLAARNAVNAIRLFKRFKNEEWDLYLHFKNIILNVIAGEPNVTIVPLYIQMIKNYRKFNPPETEFDRYAHFHIILITKLVCQDYSNIQNLFSRLKDWIVNNLPEDEIYIQIMEMVVRGDNHEAYKAVEKVRQRQRTEEKEPELRDFYHFWYIATKWLIKERIF